MTRSYAPIVATLSSLLLMGCGDLMGLNGYTDAVDGGGDASRDASPDAVADTGADSAADSGADASPDAADSGADACAPKTEDCTNGTDDDCDGLSDCMDTDCTTGFTCVPPLPNGWTWATYAQNSRPACATGYGSPKDVNEGIVAAAATCGCACGTTNPTCTGGNLTIHAGSGGGCVNVTNQTGPASAGCHVLGASFGTNNQNISVAGPAPSGGSCTPNGTSMVPALTYQHQGRTCGYAGAAGAGCTMGNVCLPKANPFNACVSMTGMNACPNGFPVQHLVGSNVTDTRGCSQCTCAFNAGTCAGTATFYTNNACANNPQTVAVDGACHGVANRTWTSYTYAPANAGVSCAPSAVNPNGAAAFSDLTTVCCTN